LMGAGAGLVLRRSGMRRHPADADRHIPLETLPHPLFFRPCLLDTSIHERRPISKELP